jgi:predicted metal-binding membrane protein
MALPTLATRARHDPGTTVWVVAGICWVAIAWLAVSGGDELGHHDVVLAQSDWPWAARIGAFLAIWLVMIGAMMLPTVVPMVRLFVPVSARSPRPVTARAAFFGAYIGVWATFAPLALLGDAGVHALVDRWSWLGARPELVLGSTLALAGGFQFTPLKNACLTACRSPASFLRQHYRRGPAGAWRLGVRHAMSCLGCCWALMLVMFATGVGSLAWMLALTAVMVLEKTSRWGARLVVPVGIALLVAGLVIAAPALIPIGGPS